MIKFENNLELISNLLGNNKSNDKSWFVGFGSLLYLIRDHKHCKDYNQDIDICYMADDYEQIRPQLLKAGIKSNHQIVDDRTGKILFDGLSFEDGMSLDIFTWLKSGENIYHTYDLYMQFPVNGIPSKYHFKSLPIRMLHPLGNVRYEYKYDKYTYIPRMYGTILDYWYPGWVVPDPEFGVSKAEKILNIESCAHL